MAQARDIERFDKDAASQLRAQAQAAQSKLYGTKAGEPAPYDPMAMYARVLRFYNGAIQDRDLETMDYRRFLGYLREAELISEEERNATNNGREQSSEVAHALGQIPRAQAYEGEVVQLI